MNFINQLQGNVKNTTHAPTHSVTSISWPMNLLNSTSLPESAAADPPTFVWREVEVTNDTLGHVETTNTSVNNGNGNNSTSWPPELLLQEKHVFSIIMYSLLFVVSAPANISVIVTLLNKRKRIKRLNLMLLHLAIADLIVTFVLMPMEVAWSATVRWMGGEALCRLLKFLAMFGIYLSNNVVVCISVDRYCAVVRPMALLGTANRCKRSLAVAWVFSALCSLPLLFIFYVSPHPMYRHLDFEQCVDINSFPNSETKLAYRIMSFVVLMPLPLLVIVFCYARIVMELSKRSTHATQDPLFRTSDSGFFVRARQRTLQMTFVIVLTFVICWTPYNIMSLWYWVDAQSASAVHATVQRALFVFAVANSCANPLVYAFYHSHLCLMPESRSENNCSKRHKSQQSVELAILETQRTTDSTQSRPLCRLPPQTQGSVRLERVRIENFSVPRE